MIKLTAEEVRIIRRNGNGYFNPRDMEAWLNANLRTNNFQTLLRFTAASAYLEAARAEIRARSEERREHRAKNNFTERSIYEERSGKADRAAEKGAWPA